MIIEKKIDCVGSRSNPSFAVVLPKLWCKTMGVGAGSVVDLTIKGRRIIIKPKEETEMV